MNLLRPTHISLKKRHPNPTPMLPVSSCCYHHHLLFSLYSRQPRVLPPPFGSSKMSLPAADEKTSAGGGGPIGSPARWLIPKFLTSALILALFLILLLDASLISLGATNPRPSAADLQTYLIATTLSPSTTKNLSAAAAAAAANFSTPSPLPPSAAESPTPANTISQSTNDSAASSSQEDVAAAWISVALPANFTSTLLSRWLTPGGQPCRDSQTCAISVPGLDGIPHHHHSRLAAGEVHTFIISALDELGNKRCLGGDYFETDLSGESWKSRPPITDHGNGSYSFKLQVHPDFAGNYTLTIVLLFRSFHGLKFSPERFKFRRELRRIPISFYRTSRVSLPELNICRSSDFFSEFWSGRWTRHARNDQCVVDDAGRFRCLEPDFLCQSPWCDGTLAALESNGWVYSAHCSFRIFSSDLAWKCLNNRWLFFWGDSNHVDTIRNLLNFVLGLTDIPSVPRRFDMKFTNRRNESESVRITSIFNGHWNDTKNYLGLESLKNEYFRRLLWQYFSEDGAPDVMIFNSGLHDGVYWRSIRAFADGAEYAAKFWEEILMHIKRKGLAIPRIFYRTTIATGGYARDLAFNPNKMEAFNGVVLDKLKGRGLITGGVVDEFDMTFPWHYDNRCNDGVHYGRAPAKTKWRDGEIGHQYFVDLMLAHVLLNAICND